MFEVMNLNFFYSKKKVLNDLNFKINQFEFISIIGPNGSGKSTLLNLLAHFIYPKEGKIFLFDKLLKDYKIEDLSKIISYVPQETTIRFPFSCMDVVLSGRSPYQKRISFLKEEDLDIVKKSLKLTDTFNLAESLITEISGGEKQRIIFAKALAQKPMIFLLDEAFTAMDINHQIRCLNTLKDMVKKKEASVIAVMHDLNMVDLYSDTVIVLDKGKLIKYGKRTNVMKSSFLNSIFKVKIKKIKNKGLFIMA